MTAIKLPAFLRTFSFKELREFGLWAVLTVVFLCISAYGRTSGVPASAISQYALLFAINSAIFFSLFRHYPMLGVTMLIFIIFFELSVFGYYFFSATSLNV